MPRCGIVILAAGASVRMGVAKQSLEFGGSTLLQRAVATAVGSVCRPVVVVLGAGAEELQKFLPSSDIQLVINSAWSSGMGSSIRAGIAALRGHGVDAAMIFLCDQPLVSSAKLDEMVEQHFASDHLITAAVYAKTTGTPVIFASGLFDELVSLEDTQGGKAILNRHRDQVLGFDLPEAAIDIDTPADFKRLKGHRS